MYQSFTDLIMAIWLSLCAVAVMVAYLLGSFPTGYITAKQLKGIDIREAGSGSTGATNVLRTLGRGPGVLVLIVDCFKGILAIALVYWLFAVAATQNYDEDEEEEEEEDEEELEKELIKRYKKVARKSKQKQKSKYVNKYVNKNYDEYDSDDGFIASEGSSLSTLSVAT